MSGTNQYRCSKEGIFFASSGSRGSTIANLNERAVGKGISAVYVPKTTRQLGERGNHKSFLRLADHPARYGSQNVASRAMLPFL